MDKLMPFLTHQSSLLSFLPFAFHLKIMSIDILSQISQHKIPLMAALAGIFMLSLVSHAAPKIVDIFTFFGPLLVSTAVLVVAIVAFTSVSQVPNEPHGEKAGEGILKYVACPSGFGEEQW